MATESKTSKKTNFQMESAAAATPSTAMAIFGDGQMKGMTRRNMPPMIKPGDVPVGQAISGEIIAIVDSPITTIKGKLLHIKHESGTEFTFPCTGVIRNALAPGKDEKELPAALEKFVGKMIVAKRLGDKTSAKYKKTMYMFDVFTN